MSLPIDVLQELFLAEREQSKALKDNVNQLRNEVDGLRNELSSARNHNEMARSVIDGMQSSKCDEVSMRELQSRLVAANASLEEIQHVRKKLDQELRDERRYNAELQVSLKQTQHDKADLEDLLKQMQDTLDRADRHGALVDDRDVEDLQESLKEVHVELDHAEDYSMRRQPDLVAANETNRELRVANEQLQSDLVAADDTSRKLQNSLRKTQLQYATAYVSNMQLQREKQLLRNHLKDAVAADWKHVRPYLDEKLRQCCHNFKAELHSRRVELSKVKRELSNVKGEFRNVKRELSKANTRLLRFEADSTKSQVQNRALEEDLETKSAASEIDAQRKKTSESAAKAKMTPGEREQLNLKDRDSVYFHSGW